jgi:hypothetical protein
MLAIFVLYREFYSRQGSKEKDLPTVGSRLAVSNETTVDGEFRRGSHGLTAAKKDLERWIQEHPDPRENFFRDFIVVHNIRTRQRWANFPNLEAISLPGRS